MLVNDGINMNNFKFYLIADFLSRHEKEIKIILSIVGVIIIAIAIKAYFTQGLSDVAKLELSAIKSGDMTTAYNLTSKPFQSNTTPQDFQNYVEKYPIFKNYKHISFNKRKVKSGVGYISGIAEGSDGSSMKVEFQMVKENNAWKIQALGVSSTGVMEANVDAQSSTQIADASGNVIKDVLVNNSASKEGVVAKTSSTLSKLAPKIFITIQISSPKGNGSVDVTLTQPSGENVGSFEGNITAAGTTTLPLSFTRSANEWPVGKYTLIVSLPSGESKKIQFVVK